MSEYLGTYRGAVYDVEDPERRGRIRALVPQVLGESPTAWAEPSVPTPAIANFFAGDRIWVSFEGGDVNRPIYAARLAVNAGDLSPDLVDIVIPGAPTDAQFKVTGMPRGFLLQVLNAPASASFVYTVTDVGTGSSYSYPATTQSVMYAEVLPDNTPFMATSVYTWHVTITAASGEVFTSPETSSQTLVLNDSNTIAELNVGQLTFGTLVGASAILGALEVADLSATTFTGLTIQTDTDPTKGIHIDKDGIRAYSNSGTDNAPFLNVDPDLGLVIVAGEGTFQTLTITGKTSLDDTDLTASSILTMLTGTVAPATAPSVGSGYDTVVLKAPTEGWNYMTSYSPAKNAGEYVAAVVPTNSSTLHVKVFNAFGAQLQTSPQLTSYTQHDDYTPAWAHAIYAPGADKYYVAYYDGHSATSPKIRIAELNPTTLAVTAEIVVPELAAGSTGRWDQNGYRPALGWDSTPGLPQPLTFAQVRSTHVIWYCRINFNGGSPTYSSAVNTGITPYSATNGYDLCSVMSMAGAGSAVPFDFAAGAGDRMLFACWDTNRTYVMNTSTVAEIVGEEWEFGGSANRMGEWWDPTGAPDGSGAFKSIDTTGVIRTYTKNDMYTAIGSANLTKWISYTYYKQVAGYETPKSPSAKLITKKRQRIDYTAGVLPTSPGPNDPDSVTIYIGSGTTDPGRTGSYWQTNTTAGVRAGSIYFGLVTAGSIPPVAPGTFPTSGPSKIQSQALGYDGVNPAILLQSDGVFAVGNYTSTRHFGSRTRTTNQTIPNNTVTQLVVGTTKSTTTISGVTWDGTGQTWVVNKPGVYIAVLNVNWTGNATGRRTVQIRKNSGARSVKDEYPGHANNYNQVLVAVLTLAAGDTVDAAVVQTSGGNLDIIGTDENRLYLDLTFVGS